MNIGITPFGYTAFLWLIWALYNNHLITAGLVTLIFWIAQDHWSKV